MRLYRSICVDQAKTHLKTKKETGSSLRLAKNNREVVVIQYCDEEYVAMIYTGNKQPVGNSRAAGFGCQRRATALDNVTSMESKMKIHYDFHAQKPIIIIWLFIQFNLLSLATFSNHFND